MGKYLRPRRGNKNDAYEEDIVLLKGEIFLEYPEGKGIGKSAGRIIIGDGDSSYKELKDAPEEPTDFQAFITDPSMYIPVYYDSKPSTDYDYDDTDRGVTTIGEMVNAKLKLSEVISKVKKVLCEHTDNLRFDNDRIVDLIESTAKLDNKINAATYSLDTKINSATASFDTRITNIDNKVNAATLSIDTKINSATSTLNNKINTSTYTLDNKINAGTSTLNNKINTSTYTLDQNIKTKVSKTGDTMTGNLLLQTSQDSQTFLNTITPKYISINNRSMSSGASMNSDGTITATNTGYQKISLTGNDVVLDRSSTVIPDVPTWDGTNKSLKSAISTLNNKINASTYEINLNASSIRSLNTKINSATSSLNNSITSLDNKVNSATSSLNSKINSATSSLDSKINSATSSLNSKINTSTYNLNSSITSLDSKVNSATSSLNSKIATNTNYISGLKNTNYVDDIVVGTVTVNTGTTSYSIFQIDASVASGETFLAWESIAAPIQELPGAIFGICREPTKTIGSTFIPANGTSFPANTSYICVYYKKTRKKLPS
jgi:hypothetical protein